MSLGPLTSAGVWVTSSPAPCPRTTLPQGTSLQSALRWERDIVRLERCVLAQGRSRYELQGARRCCWPDRLPACWRCCGCC
jgi:hypothetical protein